MTLRDSQLNIYNFKMMRSQPPQSFEFLRFDSNNNCNVHCVYCHNHRSAELVGTEEFQAFLDQNVIDVTNFQVGCNMEPTLDDRLCDLMLRVARSRAKPKKLFVLQTNGILLHMHKQEKIRDAGVTHLSISIDAADAPTHKLLRGGTSLPKVLSNLVSFHRAFPMIDLIFITTVNKLNVDKMENLVTLGVDIGVKKFVLREVFFHPDSDVVDHSKMPSLLLEENDYPKMRETLLAKFGNSVNFEFADAGFLGRVTKRMQADSFR